MESGSELVSLGKLVDENSYKRESHGVMIEDVACIDYLKRNTVYEVKKSEKQLDSAVAQVKFYLYHLHLRGFDNIKGQINFPLKKKSQEVKLSEEDKAEIPKIIEEIESIINAKEAPAVEEKKLCKSCAYYDLCMI